MPTIIAQQNFNVTEPSSRVEQEFTQQVLLKILRELKKINIYNALAQDEEIENTEIDS